MSQFQALYGEVGNLTPSTGVARDKLFTNLAYQTINQHRRWSWLQSTTTIPLVTGQRVYKMLGTTPTITDFDSPISVTLELTASAARRKLPRVDPQLFEDLTGHVFTNSQPMMWTIQGDTAAATSGTVVQGGQQSIVISPPPANAAGSGVNLIVRYWRSAASIAMTADSDVPIIPVQYENMLITKACQIAMRQYMMPQEAASLQQDYLEQLAAAVDTDQQMYTGDNDTVVLKAVTQTPSQVPVTSAQFNQASRPLPQAV